ncbi:MAG TPA: biotin--[acetyl-CoA-carboxylase] ligase [Candidatus Cloacimonas sp.]|jgi:BirA family biotin operon repressor/biotin-[acetyl-CoA-carboxylase] ligase|nr:biotin--[acetyl-CoA-carboxylase] ligase [Candidatus Cloacimonas sp.]
MPNFEHSFYDEIYTYSSLNSTNKQAEKLIKQRSAVGNFLILANEQTGGRGRRSNRWFSPVGGLWFSVGLYSLNVNSSLSVYAGICMHKVLQDMFPEQEFKLKWPNDLYCNGKKVGGILTQYLDKYKYHIVGIGLNTNFTDLEEEITDLATTLRRETAKEIDNTTILTKFSDIFAMNLPELMETGKLDAAYFNQFSLLKNKKITLDTDFDKFTGVSKGINKKGAILLEIAPAMVQPFYAGTISEFEKGDS